MNPSKDEKESSAAIQMTVATDQPQEGASNVEKAPCAAMNSAVQLALATSEELQKVRSSGSSSTVPGAVRLSQAAQDEVLKKQSMPSSQPHHQNNGKRQPEGQSGGAQPQSLPLRPPRRVLEEQKKQQGALPAAVKLALLDGSSQHHHQQEQAITRKSLTEEHHPYMLQMRAEVSEGSSVSIPEPLPAGSATANPSPPAQPGAYRQAGWDHASYDSNRSIVIGDGSDRRRSIRRTPSTDMLPPVIRETTSEVLRESAALANSEGLVEADPIGDSYHERMERAEPVEMADVEKPDRSKASKASRKMFMQLFVLGLVLLILTVGLAVGLSLKGSSSNESSSVISSNDTDTNATTNTVASSWWQLPFTPPNVTLKIVQRDVNLTTPQGRAYDWMIKDPYLANYTTDDEDIAVRRFAAAVLYFSTNGDNWRYQGGRTVNVSTSVNNEADNSQANEPGAGRDDSSLDLVEITSEPWLSYNHSVCDWYSTAAFRNKEACDENSTFTYLSVMQNKLSGSLPMELALLSSQLDSVELARNEIGGTIFTEIGHMRELWKFQLFRNEITGTIPSEIGLLHKLKLCNLFSNEMKGTIPKEFWNLSNLREFHMANNKFSGSLPFDIGTRVPNVKLFKMKDNQFTGSLPSSIGLLTKLEEIDVAGNHMDGSLPTELGNLTRLLKLSTSGNGGMTGNIPSEIAKLTKLDRLYLSSNKFSGWLPSELGLLPRVREIAMSNNNLSGRLPSEIALLPRISEISLLGNEFTGSIPSEWNNLNETLTRLVVGHTSITGTIPEALCGIQELRFNCSSHLCGCGSRCPCN